MVYPAVDDGIHSDFRELTPQRILSGLHTGGVKLSNCSRQLGRVAALDYGRLRLGGNGAKSPPLPHQYID